MDLQKVLFQEWYEANERQRTLRHQRGELDPAAVRAVEVADALFRVVDRAGLLGSLADYVWERERQPGRVYHPI